MINQIFSDIFDSHFGGTPMGQQLSSLTIRERPVDPPEDKNADRLGSIQDKIETIKASISQKEDELADLEYDLKELEREYDYIASGDEEEDLRAEALERWGA